MSEYTSVYRIVKRSRAKNAFDGQGAKISPGRWNNKGNPIVYTAESQSLAMIEILANYEAIDLIQQNFVTIHAKVPTGYILSLGNLPSNWSVSPAPGSTKSLGDGWLMSGESSVLAVPSVLVPTEYNYLINPNHADFSKILIDEAMDIVFPDRIIKSK